MVPDPQHPRRGAVRVVATDVDGSNASTVNGAWAFARELTFDNVVFADLEGSTQGPVNADSILAVGEQLNLSASINHSASGVPYDGGLRIRWFGNVGPERWDGGSTVIVHDGVLATDVPTPLSGGRLMIARLEVWDPQDTVLLHSIQLDPMDVDEDHPYLVAKGDDVTWSRYHLSDVVVGVNIEEDTAWTGPLNVTCQVTSTERSWPEVTQSVLPSGLFEDLILFTATFNFSNVGDPADLDPQASLSCWASGMDDAGRTLQGATDLTASDPWFKATLTNEGPDLELGEVSLSGRWIPKAQTSWWPLRSSQGRKPSNVPLWWRSPSKTTARKRWSSDEASRDSGQTNPSSCAAVSTSQRAIGPSA